MCVFLAFSDSPYNWGGGVNDGPPENPLMVGNTMTFSNAARLRESATVPADVT